MQRAQRAQPLKLRHDVAAAGVRMRPHGPGGGGPRMPADFCFLLREHPLIATVSKRSSSIPADPKCVLIEKLNPP